MLAGEELGGERGGLAVGEPDDRLVETLDQLARADLMGEPFGLAVRNVLAIDGGGEVDRDEVARLRRPLDALEGAEPGAETLHLGLDLVIADLHGVHRDLQLSQVGKIDIGADVDLGGEHQFLAVLDLGDLDIRLAQGAKILGRHRFGIPGGQRIVDHLLQHRTSADPGLEQLGRSLTGPEPGQPNLLGELLVRAVEIRLEFRERNLNADANPGGAQFLDSALHAGTPVRLASAALGVSG